MTWAPRQPSGMHLPNSACRQSSRWTHCCRTPPGPAFWSPEQATGVARGPPADPYVVREWLLGMGPPGSPGCIWGLAGWVEEPGTLHPSSEADGTGNPS